MTTAEDFWKSVARRLDARQKLFVAIVVANTRSSPGTLGARLLVDEDANVEGTVGGGIMEVNVVDLARRRLRDKPDLQPELQRLIHRKNDQEHASGLICAGEQTNLNLILRPDRDGPAIRLFCDALGEQSAREATLLIDPRGVSVNLECCEEAAFATAGLVEESDGGWRYRESSVNPRRLAIVGGGHCGRALAKLAVEVGYWVDVFDTRPGVLQGKEWPDAARRHLLHDDSELQSQLHRKSLTTVVVMTNSILRDIASLSAITEDKFRWLGVMGSRTKIHEIRRGLRERGIASELIDTIHGPIGLPMKSDTPAEIAVSVMGQLLADSPPSTAAGPQALTRSPADAGT